MSGVAFTIGWLNLLVAVLNGVAWYRSHSSVNAFFCGFCAMYAVFVIPEYWP